MYVRKTSQNCPFCINTDTDVIYKIKLRRWKVINYWYIYSIYIIYYSILYIYTIKTKCETVKWAAQVSNRDEAWIAPALHARGGAVHPNNDFFKLMNLILRTSGLSYTRTGDWTGTCDLPGRRVQFRSSQATSIWSMKCRGDVFIVPNQRVALSIRATKILQIRGKIGGEYWKLLQVYQCKTTQMHLASPRNSIMNHES